MPRTRIGRVEEVREGEGKTVPLVPGTSAYVFRYKGMVRAFVNRCPHMGGPVELDVTTGVCVCRWHEASFDACTGHRKEGQAAEGTGLAPLVIEQEGDELVLVWDLPKDPFAF
ncbi:Rieske 2Fe-2S domain-containing protein [Patescibacteria group bacterium]|nr:Rieske 2Fe-2S domain-containing protein [Patescibacteria group bacterium]MDQ5919582.1 apoptosis-inducing factor 3 [Patescibacteria group bacterium]